MKKRIVIAGGGTAGHLYPGIAVVREWLSRHADYEVHFVGSAHGLENKIIPQEGFSLHVINVSGIIGTSRWQQVLTLLKIPIAIIQSFLICIKIKPTWVLGVGGYSSGPFVLAASWLKIPTYIWEPNAHPGAANRWLSRFVKKAFVVFQTAAAQMRVKSVVQVGLPVRSSIEYRPRAKGNKFKILIFGGSQGARAINNAVLAMLTKKEEWQNNIQIVHQTGRLDFERIKSAYPAHVNAEVVEFLNDMGERYAWSDMVIGRAGVGTVSEVITCRRPSVLIPLPSAAENHQQHNAEVLVQSGAGEMLLQKDLTPDTLKEKILSFMNNPAKLNEFEKNLAILEKPKAAKTICDVIEKDLSL